MIENSQESMENINIRELLTRTGCVIDESKEHIQMRNMLETLREELATCEQDFFEERELLAKHYLIENDRYEITKQKLILIDQQVKQKETDHEEILKIVMQNQYETDEFKKKYSQQVRENEQLRKKIEQLQKQPPKLFWKHREEEEIGMIKKERSRVLPPAGRCNRSCDNNQSVLRRLKLTKPMHPNPANSNNITTPSKPSYQHYTPTPPATKKLPATTRRIIRINNAASPLLASQAAQEQLGGATTFMPTPPKDSTPGRVYRRRHGVTFSQKQDDHTSLEIVPLFHYTPNTFTDTNSNSNNTLERVKQRKRITATFRPTTAAPTLKPFLPFHK